MRPILFLSFVFFPFHWDSHWSDIRWRKSSVIDAQLKQNGGNIATVQESARMNNFLLQNEVSSQSAMTERIESRII